MRWSKAILAGALLIAACGRASRQDLLVKHSSNFHNELRWKRLQEASIQVAPWEKQTFLKIYRENIETLQIEDYELESIAFPLPGSENFASDPTMATLVIYRFEVEAPEVTRRKVKREETWMYHDGGWYITKGY